MYYIPVLCSLLSAFFCYFRLNYGNVKHNQISFVFIIFSLFSLFILIAFKGDVEPDYYNYRDIFYNAPNLNYLTFNSLGKAISASFGIEPGILFVSSLLHFLGLHYQNLILFFSILNVTLSVLIWKIEGSINKFTYLSLFILIFYQSYFVQIRFAAGAFLAYLAIFVFFRGMKKLSLILFLFAVFFHNIAVLFLVLPLFFVTRLFWDRHGLVLLLIFFISFIDFYSIFELVAEIFFPRYVVYFSLEDDYEGNKFLFYWRFVVCFFLFFVLSFGERAIIDSENLIESFLKFCLFMNLFSWAVGYDFSIFYRVAWFFDIGLLYFLLAAKKSNSVTKQITIFFVVATLLVYRSSISIADFTSYRFDWYTY